MPRDLRADTDWARSPLRPRLLELYAEVDALLAHRSCSCAPERSLPAPCCRFALSGHEPRPTAVEIEEVRHAMRAASVTVGAARARRGGGRALPVVDGGACPLLSADSRCRVYAARPFGCRTYFCDAAEVEQGAAARRQVREAVGEIGGRIASLSAAFAPRDPGPRSLVRALAAARTNA